MEALAIKNDELADRLIMKTSHRQSRSDTIESDDVIEHAKSASARLKAMAHENRLAILFHLYDGPRSVSELCDLLDMRQPAVSQQLARLRSDNMVSTERRGKQVYYSISSDDARMVVEMLNRVYVQRSA